MHGRRSCWLKSIYGQPLDCKLSRCGYVHFVKKQHKVQHCSRASEDNEAGRPAGFSETKMAPVQLSSLHY